MLYVKILAQRFLLLLSPQKSIFATRVREGRKIFKSNVYFSPTDACFDTLCGNSERLNGPHNWSNFQWLNRASKRAPERLGNIVRITIGSDQKVYTGAASAYHCK